MVGWVLAASLAMLLASQAVAMVRDQVTDRPSRAATTLALETTTSSTAAVPSSTIQSDTTSTTAVQSPTTSSTPVVTTSTTAPDVSTTTAPTTTSTTTPTATNEEETFYLVGGWVTVGCAGDDIVLGSYAPNLGFQVDIEEAGPSEVEVKFEQAGGDHRSKLEATCNGGRLNPEIEEKDDD